MKGTPIETTINGQHHWVEAGQNNTLFRVLRDDVGLTGTDEACSGGERGACTVFFDGMAVVSCLVPAHSAHQAEAVNIAGLADRIIPSPIQEASVREGVVHSGYCTPGFLMAGTKLLEETQDDTRQEIQQAIACNLCRCAGHCKVI